MLVPLRADAVLKQPNRCNRERYIERVVREGSRKIAGNMCAGGAMEFSLFCPKLATEGRNEVISPHQLCLVTLVPQPFIPGD